MTQPTWSAALATLATSALLASCASHLPPVNLDHEFACIGRHADEVVAVYGEPVESGELGDGTYLLFFRHANSGCGCLPKVQPKSLGAPQLEEAVLRSIHKNLTCGCVSPNPFAAAESACYAVYIDPDGTIAAVRARADWR